MKKYLVFAASMVFILSISCSSSDKEKSAEKTAEKISAPESVDESLKSAKPVASTGQKLYSDNGCLVCHQLNTKLVGPSTKDIAAAYSGNKAGLIAYLKGEGEAIVDPAQASLMQPQIAITKALPAEELEALVDYILSIK